MRERQAVAADLSVVLVNQRSEIQRLSELVEQFGAAQGLAADELVAIHLVLDEIVINVVVHGYDDDRDRQIAVHLSLDGDVLTIQVVDDGKPFNPLDVPPPDLDVPLEERYVGALGIHLVRSSVDAMAYRRDGGRNILTMTKRRGA